MATYVLIDYPMLSQPEELTRLFLDS